MPFASAFKRQLLFTFPSSVASADAVFVIAAVFAPAEVESWLICVAWAEIVPLIELTEVESVEVAAAVTTILLSAVDNRALTPVIAAALASSSSMRAARSS